MSRETPLLAHEKIKLVYWGIIALAIIVSIFSGLFSRLYLAIARDEEGFNQKIVEVCDFYKVEIVEYDEHNNLYKLSIDPQIWDAIDGATRKKFCANCKEAFDRMMHRYHITLDSDSVDLMVYKGQRLVASNLNDNIDISHDIVNDVRKEVDKTTKELKSELNSIYNGIMDMYN